MLHNIRSKIHNYVNVAILPHVSLIWNQLWHDEDEHNGMQIADTTEHHAGTMGRKLRTLWYMDTTEQCRDNVP